MEARDPRPNPEGLVSQDDGGLWMKMDSNPDTDHKETPSVTCDEMPQDQTTVTPPAPAVITQCNSGADDAGADEVFVQQALPPPPSYMAPLMPVEGSTDGRVNNSRLTFANGAADATEAKANPGGLDWHHGEKQLMTAQNKLDELVASSGQTSKESVDTVALSMDKEATLSKDQTSMEGKGHLVGTYYDPSGGHHQDNTTGNDVSHEESEDIEILSERQENWSEIEGESNKYPKQVPSTLEETLENEIHFYNDGERTKSEAETQAKNVDCSGVKTNAPTQSSSNIRDEDLKSCRAPELCKNNQNNTDEATNQPKVSKITTEESNDDDEHVDTRSLNYKLAKHDWVRRESGVSETLLPRLSISEGSVETVSKGEQEKGSRRISTNIQQGEQLLQRLQLVQQRQDVQAPESPLTSQQVGPETRGKKEDVVGTTVDYTREVDLADVDEREESIFHTVGDRGAMANLMDNTESEGGEAKAWLSAPMSVNPEHYIISRTESGESDDEQSSIWGPAEWSSVDEMPSTQTPLGSSRPRLSVAETSLEKQIHEAAQKKQNLQRAGGVFNLADNLDVIEIPFKTNFSLEPLPTKVDAGQRIDRQFSEQKMQKEISQEIQRELVMVNQGKIPGAYSKGEVRQLKETKLLFEAFQQENVEGPTRHRKSPTSLTKDHVYPSVLERTRSLEMFSLKSLPMSRTHSLRVRESATFQMKKSPEDFRSKSPNGGSRDKTRLSPYSKQDKHARLYRSMDLISTGVSAVETQIKIMEGNTSQESPIVKHNPFFKLRPALVLQPEVEKDIREAREREDELRRQRCTLYGDNKWKSKDKEKSRLTPALPTDSMGQPRGKLERFWPPPSKKEQKPELTQQEAKVRRTGGQKASLWQRWESGQINGQPPKEKN